MCCENCKKIAKLEGMLSVNGQQIDLANHRYRLFFYDDCWNVEKFGEGDWREVGAFQTLLEAVEASQ